MNWFLLFLMLFSSQAFAVSVAFFEMKKTDGTYFSPEVGGRFYHVAISYKGKWLQAHPWHGVRLDENVNKIGKVAVVLKSPTPFELDSQSVLAKLGKKFDSSYMWDPQDTTYCSKLVGQLLDIPPEKTYRFPNKPNDVGLSPDDVYRELIKRGYRARAL